MDEKNKSLREAAIDAASRAYSPYSKVEVGCAVETKKGKVYKGCNIENSSFGGTVCAERVAIFSAVTDRNKEFQKIYVYTHQGWSPCGICRQVMREFCADETEVIFGSKTGETATTLGELLPHSFGPDDF